MSEWKPIESAPKDGTNVLLAGRYMEGTPWRAVGFYNVGWTEAYDGSLMVPAPTHWTELPPLPAPPKDITQA